MTQYVEKSVVESYLKRAIFGADQKIDKWVDQMPAADVRENVHGDWHLIRIYEDEDSSEYIDCYACSRCYGQPYYSGTIDKYKFCPYCGAQMDGGDAK